MEKFIGVKLGKDLKPTPDEAWLVGGLPLLVTDDGEGFKVSPEAPRAVSGNKMGLALMEGRIRLLGGALSITSQVNVGTKIAFTVPVEMGRKD